MTNTSQKFNGRPSLKALGSLLMLLMAATSPAVFSADSPVLSDSPIANTTSVQVKPNIMLLMDTSNSMKFSHMPDEIEGSNNGVFPVGYKSYQCNVLYYKPSQTYALPNNSAGVALPLPTVGAAFYNAYAEYSENPFVAPTTVVDLTTSFRAYDTTTRQFATVSDPAQPAYYYIYTTAGGVEPASLNFAAAPCTDVDTGATAAASTSGTWTRVLVSSLSADQQKNFAIWYSYYRTRIAMIKSAVSLSFTPLTDSYRVGLITVKPYPALVPTLGASVDSNYYLPIDDFGATQRQNWFAKLFSQVPGGSSPAREGLARVGRHYAGKQDSINTGMTGDPVQYACQQNFTILTTDGYWNTVAETAGPVKLDGTTLVGQQDGTLNDTRPDPNTVAGTYNKTPRPIWDGYPDTTIVRTAKQREYTLANCTSLYGPLATNQNLQSTTQNLQSTTQLTQSTSQILQSTVQNLQSTNQNLQSTAQTLQSTNQILLSTVQNLQSTNQNLQSTVQTLQSTNQNRQSTNQNLKSTNQNLQSTSQNRQSTTQTLRSTNQNLRSTNQNLQSTTQNLQTDTQNTTSTLQNLRSTNQNLRSTVQNRQSTTQTLQSTNQILKSTNQILKSTNQNRQSTTQTLQSTNQNLRSTNQILKSTNQNLQSTTQTRQSTNQNLQSTVQNLKSTNQNLQSTAQTLQSTNQNRQSTVQNLQSTVQTLQTTTQYKQSTSQWFSYDSSTELSTAVLSCTNGGTITCTHNVTTNVPVASCTPQTAAAGNLYLQITCSTTSTGPTAVASCTPVTASAGNSYTATTCTPNNTTSVPVSSCTASAATSGNGYTTTTCATNNTTNVPVATCTAATASAGNSWTTTSCPAPITTGPTAVASCTAAAASVGNSYVTTTCTPNNTTNVPVATCTAAGPSAGNAYTTTTCPAPVVTTDVPVSSCTAAAASAGNSYTTTSCSTNNTTNVPVATCTAATASAGNSWTTTTCPAPVTTGPTGVSSCTAAAASAGNSYTSTTCTPNNTTNVPVATCTAAVAGAGNNWTATTCPAPVVTTNVPSASCTAAAASAGNSWTTTTCPAPVVTTNVPVATCTAAAASAGNSWTTTTCPAPVTTGPTGVSSCTAAAAAAGNSYTTTTCTPNNTTNVPVATCAASAASAGNGWTATTCPAPVVTTNVPSASCTAAAASAGNSWTTTTCPAPVVTTNVPSASCTAAAASAGNSWTTTTCPAPVTTGPTGVSSCTAAAAAAGNSYTTTTCTPNNTTNVPVATCAASAASAGNAWTATTCPAPVVTTNVPVATCTAAAASAGNSWTTTTCPAPVVTTNVPVATCTAAAASAGNSWTTTTCPAPITTGPTITATCTPVAASAGNSYTATTCGVITNTFGVLTCTPVAPSAGNNWTTTTCSTNNTTNVPVLTCTPSGPTAGNGYTTTTCPAPIVTTNVPVATCTAAAASAGNSWTTTTCPAPIVTGPTAVSSCTAAAAAAGNSYTTTTCTPNNTTNVPVATCTASAASAGNAWTTTTCPAPVVTTNVPVATCTAAAASAGNSWTTTTCPAPVVTTNVPVATCTAAAASAGNSWTTTTCPAPVVTTNVPVATCTAAAAAAGNSWTTTTCPAPITTGPSGVASCTAAVANAGNSYTSTTCTPNNTTNVAVATCTAAAAGAGNAWTTTTCPAPVVTTNVPVASCTAAAASAGNSWTTKTCSTNNTTNVPVASCTATAASAGNGWTTTTCPAPVVTTNVPVSSCTAAAASAGNSYTTTTCTPNNTTNVPVATCTASAANGGNNWTTTTCPAAVVTTNVPVSSCTAAAAGAGNSWTTTTCANNNTTNVPVGSCTATTAAAGNGWTTTTCPAPIVTGPTGVSSCTGSAASAGNGWLTTTCGTNNTTNVPIASCTADAPVAGNGYTTTTCSTNNTTNVPVAACSAAAPAAGNAFTTTTCPPAVTTSIPEVYNCVAAAASAANSWTSTTCGPRLAGKEQRTRVGTTVTTDILSGTTLLSSTTAATTYSPTPGALPDPYVDYGATDGLCIPVGSTLVSDLVQSPDAPATTADISPGSAPANTATTTYSLSCTSGSWPCTLTTITNSGSYNSLADVAQYYYVTDLRTGTDWDTAFDAGGKLIRKNDSVPQAGTGPEDDSAKWQHMTTYTIALGVSGTLSYNKEYRKPSTTTGDFADIRTGAKAWPIWPDSTLDYANNGALYSDPRSIDDFWHTAVNGRGRYFSAGRPSDVVDGLREVLGDLGKKQGSGAAAASSSQTPVQGNNIAYVAKYATTSWAGDIEAHEIDLTDGSVLSPVLWSAQPLLDARAGYFCDNRKIYLFRSGATNNMVDFKWNSGTCSSQTVGENSTTTIVAAGTVTSVSKDLITYPEPSPPTATAQTGALTARALKAGDEILAGDVVVTSPGAVVKIEHVVSPTTTLDASEQANFGSAKIALLSQYPDMSNGTSGYPDQRGLADDDNLVNFIRGHRGHEGFVAKDSVKFYRTRSSILGDFVDAQPVFVQAPFASYRDTGYQAFKDTTVVSGGQKDRKSMIYAAANDGMLHAFYAGVVSVSGSVTSIDSTGGVEAWAFMPTIALDNLYKLADNDYANRHTFSVDGTPSVGDVYDTVAPAWKTILVGGMNKGGKGYYALDITDPDSPKAMWEFKWSSTCYSVGTVSTHGADCHIGYTFGKPIITKLANGTWVVLVTSGYNNVSGQPTGDGEGYLYVLNALTGKIISKTSTGEGDTTTPSGLAQITNFVDNSIIDNTTRYVYGGDNNGNVWKFDINAATPSATLLGVAKDPSGVRQPITTRPELGEIAGKPWVYVGTGRLLGLPDLLDVQVQSLYGFVDTGGVYLTYPDPVLEASGLRGVLAPLAMTPVTDPAENPAVGTTRESACTGNSTECARKSGWVLDLPDSGERLNIDMSLTLGTLISATNVPRNTACNIGGYSWLNFLDYRTGLSVAGSPIASGNTTGNVSAYLGETLAVGLSVMRLPSSTPGGQGKTVAVVMGSSGTPQSFAPPVNVPPPIGRRVSWQELVR